MESEVTLLATKESGWHFSARNASSTQIQAFSVDEMARKFEEQAPLLWEVLGMLLHRKNKRYSSEGAPMTTTTSASRHVQPDQASQISEDDSLECEYWDLEEERLELCVVDGDSDASRATKRQRRAQVGGEHRWVGASWVLSGVRIGEGGKEAEAEAGDSGNDGVGHGVTDELTRNAVDSIQAREHKHRHGAKRKRPNPSPSPSPSFNGSTTTQIPDTNTDPDNPFASQWFSDPIDLRSWALAGARPCKVLGIKAISGVVA
ncbi:hypothetical protein H0H92_007878 [Tricholoma furcatifolium]|nr:hypothetical protein H0H92_007878 [Tricholoma furcatifolium]